MNTLYLDLLKRTLTRTIFMTGQEQEQELEQRRQGLDWPGAGDAETMIGEVRLQNILDLGAQLLDDPGVPGDFVECGVWRGGATILMAGLLTERRELGYRKVWVCDSFEGCPKGTGDHAADPHHTYKFLAVPQKEVEENFRKYNLMSENIRFVPGFFKDTLPPEGMRQIALLRADGDLYESQTQILEGLYDKVADRGFIIIDDYYNIDSSHRAVEDFRSRRGITSPMIRVDWCAAYWRKE